MGELVKALEAAASASAPRRRASLFLWLSLVAVVVLAVASRSQQTVDWGALVMPLPTPAPPGPGPAGNGRPGQAPRRVPAAEAAPEDDEHSTMESDGGSPGEISLREPWLPARDADPRQAEPARATPLPPSSDAPLRPAAPTTPARRCATPTPGETTFLTRRTEGGTPGSASVGRYALGLEVRGGTIRAVSLRRIQPARDQLEVRHFEVADCVLHVVAASEARIYTFDLNIDRRNVTGRFAATGDRQRGNFSGDVLPVANP